MTLSSKSRGDLPFPAWGKRCSPLSVGVGIMVAHNPLHRSGRAAFPHPALASGDDAKTAQRIGMTYACKRKPACEQAPHTVPANATVLAAPAQRAMPETAHLKPKQVQRRAVHGHPVITDVARNNLA